MFKVWKLKLFFLTAWNLLFAYQALLNPQRVGLGKLGSKKPSVPHGKMARKACKFIRFFVVRKKNYCVLHSVTLCRILRPYGLDLKLNIIVTAQTDASGQRPRGHCWPSLDGKRYFDSAHDTDVERLDLLASTAGNINYWITKPALQAS